MYSKLHIHVCYRFKKFLEFDKIFKIKIVRGAFNF